ncbi:alpha/beta hydrolase [Bradyrhizobium tropiciagri]|uniref:alpha/beta fold hydrolase n=1 Tax=Bradyrhizobium tropiciagri TaxID=312253 RepID=UPI001BA4D6E6|nr:alpha/beta hydrolase [Bradyrhizobium tropiciagri]MBR0894958.1 alpha/beta hydrolase [Bradyrhizobium tropiciagri]
MFDGFTLQKRTIDQIEIAYRVAGEGPPVLLLHGFPQNMTMWAYIAPLIVKSGYTVVCADLRGYGDSAKPKCLPDLTNYSFRAFAQDQIGLMRELGYDRFHVIGHDRGARTGHRMALDHPEAVLSLAILDIVPTYTMFMDVNRHVAKAYWHWYFLTQPEPFPETIIASNPDAFYGSCLFGMGRIDLSGFDPQQIADYRRCWQTPEMIHGSCSDYRAAATVDLELDSADIDRKVDCPSLVFFGAKGHMARLFDMPKEWSKRLSNMTHASLPGAHFFPDEFPRETADELIRFLDANRNQ